MLIENVVALKRTHRFVFIHFVLVIFADFRNKHFFYQQSQNEVSKVHIQFRKHWRIRIRCALSQLMKRVSRFLAFVYEDGSSSHHSFEAQIVRVAERESVISKFNTNYSTKLQHHKTLYTIFQMWLYFQQASLWKCYGVMIDPNPVHVLFLTVIYRLIYSDHIIRNKIQHHAIPYHIGP